MGYDFSRFSPQSFERFAQALVTKRLGNGVQIFGAGADGAREASYEGSLPIQTHGHQWNGYVVAQAKYRSSVQGGTSDAAWLQKELEKDLKQFLDKDRGLRKPEYYLVVTNVVLSPMQSGAGGKSGRSRKGGQEKLQEFFKQWQKKLGLKGWDIWHSDTLTSMLDDEEAIRTRYSAWITEGDVLSAALSALRGPVASEAIPRALTRELKRERDIKRKDAGQVTNKRIFLDDVFVDLPVQRRFEFLFEDLKSIIVEDEDIPNDHGYMVYEPEEIDNSDYVEPYAEEDTPRILQQLMLRAADKLDAASLREEDRVRSDKPHPRRNRIVLLGGPGQGKSTVAQFLVQVFRALIVKDLDPIQRANEADEAADAVLTRAQAEGVTTNGVRRYPIHIELPKFADQLALASKERRQLSLLSYATNLISSNADEGVNIRDMRAWLGSFPWLLVLDGLDEVPPSANRSDVVAAINDFWDEVHEANADILVLVTTRPQGYGDDLPRRHWEHWDLASLSTDDALRFAERLASILLSDGSRREEILSELKRAGSDKTTAPIMISPLQVAILFSLVETKGGVPTDRWTLFHRYYDLLRDREAAKEGSTGRLLRDYRDHIDQVHYDAGFLLHVRSEHPGTANPYLSEDEFRSLVERQLRSDGHNEDTVRAVAGELVRIATDRLVLLGCRTGGHIAFDVRSLQEFMAAARIMSSPESMINDRLREIAGRSHWRHVLRIAVSKVFALSDLRYLRSPVIHLCDALDSGDLGHEDGLLRSGARLALELLDDNVAARLPENRRSLVSRALGVLDIDPDPSYLRLLAHIDQDTKSIFEEKLSERISQGSTLSAVSAWKILLAAARPNSEHSDWAAGLVLNNWPVDPDAALDLFSKMPDFPMHQDLVSKIKQTQAAASPESVRDWFLSSFVSEELEHGSALSIFPVDLMARRYSKFNRAARLDFLPDASLVFEYISVERSSLTMTEQVGAHQDATALSCLTPFLSTPNRITLAETLEAIDPLQLQTFYSKLFLPWPLATLMAGAKDKKGLSGIAERARNGDFGDIEDWKLAEERWASSGLSEADIKMWLSEPLLPSNASIVGSPYPSRAIRQRAGIVSLDNILRLIEGVTASQRSAVLLHAAMYQYRMLRSEAEYDALPIVKEILRYREESPGVLSRAQILNFLSSVQEVYWDNNEVVDLACSVLSFGDPNVPTPTFPALRGIIKALRQAPEKRLLLAFVAAYGLSHTRLQAELLAKLPNELFQITGDESRKMQSDIAIASLMVGYWKPDELEQLAEHLAIGSSTSSYTKIARMIIRQIPNVEIASKILYLYGQRVVIKDRPNSQGILEVLRAVLNTRRSKLIDPSLCTQLGLPVDVR
jgi:hypothetical protein